ncbi:protein SOB FIVE-LIKE 5-like isoform X1 [Gossypium arboreum]|uniref:protein SOB FIVE-LIKE 5-like isoform X1 n=1 Tax=Gossypium arboreum TaxID=29729 RepID=UPI0008192600|nr:protein SOB FIVE-LIKE 5-like isoform X1 [Gossypium arboreum]
MNLSASQRGSGCESGWTFYLDQSSYSQTRCQNFGGNFDEVYGVKGDRFGVEDEEEGLSMVSDASSGPRHYYCQDYVECLDENRSFCSHPVNLEPANKTSKNKKQMKEHCSNNQQHSFLDDTASSPVISFSEKNINKDTSMELLDFSQGFSGTHFKGKSSSFQKKLGFLKSGKAGSKNLQGRSKE